MDEYLNSLNSESHASSLFHNTFYCNNELLDLHSKYFPFYCFILFKCIWMHLFNLSSTCLLHCTTVICAAVIISTRANALIDVQFAAFSWSLVTWFVINVPSTGPSLDSDCHLKFKWTCAGGTAERSHGGPSSTRKQKHKGKINIKKEEETAAMCARRLLVMEEVFGTLRFSRPLLF